MDLGDSEVERVWETCKWFSGFEANIDLCCLTWIQSHSVFFSRPVEPDNAQGAILIYLESRAWFKVPGWKGTESTSCSICFGIESLMGM